MTEKQNFATGPMQAAATPDRVMAATAATLAYAVLIGFTDTHVQTIAKDAGLWQFHASRTAMALPLLWLVCRLCGIKLWPRNLRAVAARSFLHGTAMLLYFGALAFLPVAMAAAGLFAAPIFLLLISRFAYGQHIGPLRLLAVSIGFLGVLLVLGPHALAGASGAAILPLLAAAFYAMGNLATRQWCAGETAACLLGGFFVMLGIYGVIGLAVLTLWPLEVPQGTAGFIQRGAVWPSGEFWFWTLVQAAGSLLAVGLVTRAYQLADAGRVSVLEYATLPASAFWGWLIRGESLTLVAWAGIALIICAGLLIVTGGAKRAAPNGRQLWAAALRRPRSNENGRI